MNREGRKETVESRYIRARKPDFVTGEWNRWIDTKGDRKSQSSKVFSGDGVIKVLQKAEHIALCITATCPQAKRKWIVHADIDAFGHIYKNMERDTKRILHQQGLGAKKQEHVTWKCYARRRADLLL